MRKGLLYKQTIETIVSYCKKEHIKPISVVKILNEIQKNEGPISFIRENNGSLIIRLLEETIEILTLESYEFPTESLYRSKICKTTFINCHFQTTSICSSEIVECIFENCFFDRIELESNHNIIERTIFKNCTISSVENQFNDIS